MALAQRFGWLGPAMALTLGTACAPQTVPQASGVGAVAPSEPLKPAPAPQPGIVPGALAASDRAACLASGGFVERRGMLGREMCIHRYADGGKACTDRSDCSGRCISEEAMTPRDHVTGICQRDDALFGCFGEVEKGRVRGGLCVD